MPNAKLIGCVVAHPLSVAYRALPSADGGGVIRHDGNKQRAVCGVSHVWVTADHRRRGVGLALLDAIRRNMATGFEVPRNELAFCQPTARGRALAAAYVGKDAFLVYDDVE
eukprot:CAMPEP_0119319340 /NCGR_PEP_ID=MMETSP1333-20130426/49144_1 /TAXON_ID=418940 /ORGANISM="Scyphosphaera apsteinii, Strain RCC1455" /LENGTH=110 /DNA_ID=CAMNT_0007325725 /DNA_START=8 /DNA_END=340 /DNA_ORIENTATION=+